MFIIDQYQVCVYCMEPKHNKFSCCSENHFDLAYEFDDGEIMLDSEVTKDIEL